MTKGPIVIVDDDEDDREIYTDAIKTIGIPNEIRFFNSAQAALDYLYTTTEQPFIILSDVNMPGMTGIQFRGKIQQDDYLSSKGILFRWQNYFKRSAFTWFAFRPDIALVVFHHLPHNG
jgi:CheY-like chemotaxis protein